MTRKVDMLWNENKPNQTILLNVILCYHREAQRFSCWQVQDVLLDVCAYIAAFESMSALSDWYWFKNSELIIS